MIPTLPVALPPANRLRQAVLDAFTWWHGEEIKDENQVWCCATYVYLWGPREKKKSLFCSFPEGCMDGSSCSFLPCRVCHDVDHGFRLLIYHISASSVGLTLFFISIGCRTFLHLVSFLHSTACHPSIHPSIYQSYTDVSTPNGKESKIWESASIPPSLPLFLLKNMIQPATHHSVIEFISLYKGGNGKHRKEQIYICRVLYLWAFWHVRERQGCSRPWQRLCAVVYQIRM